MTNSLYICICKFRWTKWLFDVIMKPIEWAIDLILRPFRSTIESMINKINPFGGVSFLDIDNVIGGIINYSWSLSSKLDYVDKLTTSNEFEKIANTLADGLAIVLSAIYNLLSQVIEQCAKNIEFLDNLLEQSNVMASLTELLSKEKDSDKSMTLSHLLLKMKARSIDGPSARVQTYLKINISSSSHTSKDLPSETKLRQYIHHDNSYEMTPYFIDETGRDEQTPYFQREQHNSWFTASLAGILHHTELMKHAGALHIDLNAFIELRSGVVPQISDNGVCTVELFTNFDIDNADSFTVDTRLPVKIATLDLPDDVTEIPTSLVKFVRNKVFAPIHHSFSPGQLGSYSWAMLEKVLICKLGATRQESIGCGVHLLSGLRKRGRYVKIGNDTWTMQNVELTGDFHNQISLFNSVSGQISSASMIEYWRNCTLSMYQLNNLKLANQNVESTDEATKVEIEERMKKLSMFIVLSTDGMAHPIICHDTTEEGNPLYSPGVLFQPLMNLGGVKEIWEYSLGTTITSPSPSIQTTEAIDTQSTLYSANRSRTRSLGNMAKMGTGTVAQLLYTVEEAHSSNDGSPTFSCACCDDNYENMMLQLIRVISDKIVLPFLGGLSMQDSVGKNSIIVLKASHPRRRYT